jgi:hypothetical protein
VTPEQLAEIEDRARSATPGPWASGHKSWAGENAVLSIILNGLPVAICGEETANTEHPASADAEFIAHARQDVPALVAEVRRLQDELDNYL